MFNENDFFWINSCVRIACVIIGNLLYKFLPGQAVLPVSLCQINDVRTTSFIYGSWSLSSICAYISLSGFIRYLIISAVLNFVNAFNCASVGSFISKSHISAIHNDTALLCNTWAHTIDSPPHLHS